MAAYAGACLFALSAFVLLPSVVMTTSSQFATSLAFAASGLIACIGALLTGYGAYRNDLEAGRCCRGCCPRCGYDLRESTGRCPECGRTFRRA